MGKKKFIQIILFIFLLLISFLIVNNFYKKDNLTLKANKKVELKNSDLVKSNENKNIIENIRYTSNNTNGDIFEILAKYGEPNKDTNDLLFLTSVEANIFLKNKTDIKIVSDYANFNSQTFETTFKKNVKILREDETILGNELYLVFDQTDEVIKDNPDIDQNLIRISNDVIVKKPGYILKADILEIDLITKNIKIYMMNEYKKVIATSEIK